MNNHLLKYFNDFPLRERKDSLLVGVVAGGFSPEREVSLSTGKAIHGALLKLGYTSKFIDFKEKHIGDLKELDVAFVALHGKYGEDGTVQGLLELLNVPYTGSGVLSSAIAMDKIYSKKIFELEGILTPPGIYLDRGDKNKLADRYDEIGKKIGYPVIVKPNRGGSTIGVTILQDGSGLQTAAELAYGYDSRVIVEKYIKGRLLTVSIIGADPVCLPIIEIRPKSGFYDYRSKYTPGLTEYLVPAPVNDALAKEISAVALKCHTSLDCSGISRVDLILGDDGQPYFLEVNTIPGMTSTSLVPKAADAAGIDFETLVEIILNSAGLKV
jgi:D-alanine-D-alanine ligase